VPEVLNQLDFDVLAASIGSLEFVDAHERVFIEVHIHQLLENLHIREQRHVFNQFEQVVGQIQCPEFLEVGLQALHDFDFGDLVASQIEFLQLGEVLDGTLAK